MMRTIVFPALALLGALLIAASLMATAPELVPSASKPMPTAVRVVTVQPDTVQLSVHSQGTVNPSVESQLIPEVSGRLVEKSPNLVAGGYFEAGDELARIDDLDYRNSRDRAKASLLRAEADYEHAKFEYQRLGSLAERKLTSRSQLENAMRVYRMAKATFDDTRVNFEQAEENLKRTVLYAPFSGLVRNEKIDIGQFVSRGQTIATLYAADQVEIRLPIADRQLAFLNLPPTQRGALPVALQPSVTLHANYAGQALRWQGKVVRTEAEIDISSRMVQLVASVANMPGQIPLTVGLFVEADIEGLAAQDVVSLPRSALRNDNKVLVVDAQNRLQFRDIVPLRIYKDRVLVRQGLKAGELVCVSPLQTAVTGMQVEPIEDANLIAGEVRG